MNGTVAKNFGGDPKDFVGKSFYELHPEAAEEYIGRIREVIDCDTTKDYEDIVMFPRGERRLLSNVHPIRQGDGEIVGAQIVSQDITDRKKSEELQLQAARFKAVADLAAGVAHNFNNLLQIVIGHLEMALEDLETKNYSEVKNALKLVLDRSMIDVLTVKRLQTFAEIRDHTGVSESGVFDLSETAGLAVEMSETSWKTQFERNRVKVALHTTLKDGCFVKGEKNEILEVIVNLLRNAADAVLASGGGDIEVDSFVHDDRAVLKVHDTGTGISEENLARLFNPFFTTKSEPGSGLGLASSRKTIDDHGGHITVDSEEGKGTTFTVVLPLAEERPRQVERFPPPSFEQPITVLAIDDEKEIVNLIESWMTRCGHTALTAVSGRQALDILMENPVDVVICDLVMPEMNGWEVGKRIRRICNERGVPKTPFILLTGWGGQKTEAEKIAESGVDGVVDKPLNAAKLLGAIKDVVEKGQLLH